MASADTPRLTGEAKVPAPGMRCDLDPDSDVLVLAFGGIAGAMDIPVFEFRKAVSDFGVKQVFLRAHSSSWYHRGVAGVGIDIDTVAASLAQIVADSGVRRTVALGNSAGGYGALLFGHLLAVDEVYAFSPQAFIDRTMLHAIGDRRWEDELHDLERSGQLDPRYADLAPFLSRSAGEGTVAHVYFSERMSLDAAHAKHLAGIDQVELHGVEEGGHRLVRPLRDSGELHALLERALRARG
jgi:hypothetical protein